MKNQDPLTRLLTTKLTSTQLKLVTAFLRQRVSDHALERAKDTLRHAYYHHIHALEDTYKGNGELVKAKVALATAEKHLSQLLYDRSVAVERLAAPLWKRLETILNDARTGKLTPEQLKEAVDAFCKGLEET